MELAKQQVAATADALPLNLKGIRSSLYLASVVDFNLAQLKLIRALGEPPQDAM